MNVEGVAGDSVSAVFSTGSFSPVRLLSSMLKSAARVIRISAGMRSPVWNRTRSPVTSCVADIVVLAVSADATSAFNPIGSPVSCIPGFKLATPVRITCALCGTNWFNASKLFSLRYSCTNATVTTMKTAMVMLIASEKLPIIALIPALARRRRMSVSLNCFTKRSHSGSGSS